MEYRFRDIRVNSDLRQIDVASVISISRGAYANIEAETANIKLRLLLKYCNSFNLNLDYVCDLTTIPTYQNLKKIDSIDKNVLAERLSIIEKEQHKASYEIARELGVSNSTYSLYKSSNRDSVIQTLMLKYLAKTYGYSMDWLIGRSDIKYIKDQL